MNTVDSSRRRFLGLAGAAITTSMAGCTSAIGTVPTALSSQKRISGMDANDEMNRRFGTRWSSESADFGYAADSHNSYNYVTAQTYYGRAEDQYSSLADDVGAIVPDYAEETTGREIIDEYLSMFSAMASASSNGERASESASYGDYTQAEFDINDTNRLIDRSDSHYERIEELSRVDTI